MERYVELDQVGMHFDGKKGRFVALKDVNLTIARGEFVSLIGHSGCGKSTVLNLIAGLLLPTDGIALANGREIAGPGPERAVVFQNHSLLPWLSCWGNVHLAVERVFGARETRAQLAGIARALAMAPKVLLLDEPFGALDALTRAHLQDELMGIVEDTGSTVVMVTHDVDEAVLLSDRIVMMSNGPAATIGDILEVPLARPRDRLALATDPEYQRLRAEVLDFLYRRHARPEAA